MKHKYLLEPWSLKCDRKLEEKECHKMIGFIVFYMGMWYPKIYRIIQELFFNVNTQHI